MLFWATYLYAIDPADGKLKKWAGPHITGITLEDAEKNKHAAGMDYLTICGLLIVDTKPGNDPYIIRNN